MKKKHHKHEHKEILKKEEPQPYVRIGSPLNLRKIILRAAIDTTKLQRDYESYKILKQEKLNKVTQLVDVLKEIEHLSRRLRHNDLPVVEEVEEAVRKIRAKTRRTEKPQEEPKEEKPEKIVFKEPKIKRTLSPTEKLNQELKDIEDRLRNLKI